MIYTLTFNPALDYTMNAEKVIMGVTNRSANEEICFGGKGINVSFVLNQLGCENTALGFACGFTGDFLISELKKHSINTDFIKLKDGFTRINVKLKGELETEINAQGPEISKSDFDNLKVKIENLTFGDTLVLAGSIPDSLPNDTYSQLLEIVKNKGVRVVVDATGELLLSTLEYNPFLIKPNQFELEQIVGKKLNTEEEILLAAKKLKEKGAVNVMVSLGEKGLLLVDGNGDVYKQEAFKISLVNSVGAGDSAVAGFIAGFENGNAYALKLAAAAGAATAGSQNLALKEQIEWLLKI